MTAIVIILAVLAIVAAAAAAYCWQARWKRRIALAAADLARGVLSSAPRLEGWLARPEGRKLWAALRDEPPKRWKAKPYRTGSQSAKGLARKRLKRGGAFVPVRYRRAA